MSFLYSSPERGGGPPRISAGVEGQRHGPTCVGLPLHHSAAPSGPPPRAGEDFSGAASRLAGFAALVLGWAPDVFWRATPDELACVVAVLGGDAPAPVDARAVAALMEEFPDG